MGDKVNYQFRLRPDMPEGFMENERYPELPTILEYLKPYDQKSFSSIEEFKEKVLKGFLGYLTDKKVPVGDDPLLRKGLAVEELPERFEKMKFDYFVYTPAANGPGKCMFGGLEKITFN